MPENPTAENSGGVRRIAISADDAGQRLDNFLQRTLKGVPKGHIYRLIRSGQVRISGRRAHPDTRLAAGEQVRLPPVRVAQREAGAGAAAPPRAFAPLFEDDALLALNKPAGVAVHGGSGVSFGLIEQARRARPALRFLELAHRLDRETSGVLLLAKKRSALTALQEQWRQRRVKKHYLALVLGSWPAKLHTIDTPLRKYLDAAHERRVAPAAAGTPGALSALTRVRVQRRYAGFTLLCASIHTGRTHQIRVHLAAHGCPIAGDAKYGDFAANHALRTRGLQRMFLHAWQLELMHPLTGEPLRLQAPLPPHLEMFLDTLGMP